MLHSLWASLALFLQPNLALETQLELNLSVTLLRGESAHCLPKAMVLEASVHPGFLEHGKVVEMVLCVSWAWLCPPAGSERHYYLAHKDRAEAPLLQFQHLPEVVCSCWSW